MAAPTPFAFDTARKVYEANGGRGSGNPDDVLLIARPAPFLISAPHSVQTLRWKSEPFADKFTGPLAEQIASELDASALTYVGAPSSARTWAPVGDRPDDRPDAFQRHIEQAVAAGAIVVDVHGMSDEHAIDVCVGLGPRPSTRLIDLANEVVDALRATFTVGVNEPFAARGEHTVTRFVQTALDGDAIQIECSLTVRETPERRDELVRTLVQVLGEWQGRSPQRTHDQGDTHD